MVRRVTVRSLQFKFEGVAMRGFCSLLSVLACSLWLIPAAQAQSGKGAIAGHVTDSSGGALIGAQAAVQPGGVNVASDGRGQFFVNDLDPGSYTVTVTYVGFEPFTQTLDVTAGRAASVDAKLEVESVSLKVLVTAERASGEAEAINREITADNIVQVLPADVIRSLPNANMADALGRLPSVTKARASTCRFAEPSRALPTPLSTASTFLRRSRVFAKSNLTPFPRTSSSRWKSIRPCRPTWTATASAAP